LDRAVCHSVLPFSNEKHNLAMRDAISQTNSRSSSLYFNESVALAHGESDANTDAKCDSR
jgi:hypothetical protein